MSARGCRRAQGASQNGEGGHSQQLQQLFETHLEETEAQIERLQECFGLPDIQKLARA